MKRKFLLLFCIPVIAAGLISTSCKKDNKDDDDDYYDDDDDYYDDDDDYKSGKLPNDCANYTIEAQNMSQK